MKKNTDMHNDTATNGALIGAMRESGWTMRAIASIVILTFGGLVTSPAFAAVKQEVQKIQWHKQDDTAAARLSAKVEETHGFLKKLTAQDPKGLDIKAAHAQVHSLMSDLASLDKGAMDNFAAVEEHIKAHNLPAEIEKRQQEAVATYRSRMDTLAAELKAADEAKDAPTFLVHVNKAKAHLDQVQAKPFHEKFDPKNLPFSVAKPTGQKPRLTKKDYEAHPVAPLKRVNVAASGSLMGIVTAATLGASVPTSPSDPSYVAPTDDVQITPAIQAEAQALHNDPVQIYNWVHNNVEYIPTYGSIQGSDMTLQTLKGNDFDQASLLIALLRAANIPARYVYGTIQVPIAQVENWVGGVTDPNAALNLLGQGGVPVNAVVQGGQIKYAQLEHVWVEAWVNFIPSRAAKSGSGNTWAPMDASFKQYTYTQGMNFDQAVPDDSVAFSQQAVATATFDPAGNWLAGMSQSFTQSGIANYQSSLWAYVQSVNSNAAVSDVLGAKNIQLRSQSALSGSLPYQVLTISNRIVALPDSLQAKLEISLADPATGSGAPSFDQVFSLPDIAGKRITLMYQSATASDQAVIDDAANNYQSSFPAYLVNVVPVIRIENSVIWTGSPVTDGTPETLTVAVSYQNVNDSRDYNVSAGDMTALGVDPLVVTSAVWLARTQSHDLSSGTESDYNNFMQELLYQTVLAYWGELDTFTQITATDEQAVGYRLPSFGAVSSPISVQYNFGVPVAASYKSRVLDIKENRIAAISSINKQAGTVDFVEKIGFISSFLESGVSDQMFGIPPGSSMSAVTALAQANNQGIQIYGINSSNISSILGSLAISDDVKADVQNSVAAGFQAVVPAGNVNVAGFVGTGYIMLDPATGSGAYRINGGRDGNNSPLPPNVFPLPQVPVTPLVGLLVNAGSGSANAKLVVDSRGIVRGISISGADAAPAAGAAGGEAGVGVLAAPVLMALAVLLLYAAAENALDKDYPRESQPSVIRKYATDKGAGGIASQNVVWATPSPPATFGLGVYFANPLQSPSGGVGCPLTGDQSLRIATAYDIPQVGVTPDPSLVQGYVDIEILRDGYYKFRTPTPVNGHLVSEIVITGPLVPWPVPANKSGLAIVIIPEFASVSDTCLSE